MFAKEAFQEDRPIPTTADEIEMLEGISGHDYQEGAECVAEISMIICK